MISKIFKNCTQFALLFGLISFVLILDQITKYLAKTYLKPIHSVAVLGDFFRLTYVENPGIAFGIRVNNKIFFTVLSIIAVVIIFYYLLKLKDYFVLRIAFAIILGGAFGNLIDRFLFGKVIDFLDFDFFNIHLPSFKLLIFEFKGYMMDRWPVFNIADMAVSTGMIIILLNALFDRKRGHESNEGNVSS